MLENKWAKLLGLVVLGLIVTVGLTLYLAGYFFLWHIKQPPITATPLTWIQYWIYYGEDSRIHFALMFCMVFAALMVFIPTALILKPRKRSLYGDAKFATRADIRASGLLGDEGVIIGAVDSFFGLSRHYLMLSSQLGVLLAAPPRSGKGAGVVNTNMLNWSGSAVVTDIRQESFRVTSGFRKECGQKVFLFNPVARDRLTCQINPLSYVSDDPILRIDDIQKIADLLSPTAADGDPFWPASCRMLFLGLALYVFETDGLPKTIGEMLRQAMYGEGDGIGEYWKSVLAKRETEGRPLSDVCRSALYDFIYTSPNTQTSIRKTFTSKLELWLNPLVDASTSADSFDLRDLRKKPITLYIGVLPGDIARLSILLNLIFQLIVDLNTREMPEDNPTELKYKCLLMMDEFTALGKMNVFLKAVSYLGGYNIIPAIIIQSPSQLRSVYGAEEAKTIMECMGAQICFAPKSIDVAKDVSESLGTFTVKDKSESKSKGFSGMKPGNGSESTSEKGRALLMPQEVKEIGKLKEIIFIENTRPILCSKIQYFNDKNFKKRLRKPITVKPIEVVLHKLPMPTPKAPEPEKAGDGEKEFMGGEWVGMQEVKPEDLERMDELDLKDFSGSYDKIAVPKEPISDRQMESLVEDFLNSVSV